MLSFLKHYAAKLPASVQLEMKRHVYRWKISKGCFLTDEPEFSILDSLVSPGDWVADIGANIGHYTKRFSELVGMHGRVIAIEPVPETFTLLAANVQCFKHTNVSLFNFAVSDKNRLTGMFIPRYDDGTKNYYQAHLAEDVAAFTVLAIALDCLAFPRPISLIKIDAEGHELEVLKGMKALLRRDHPTLIIETTSIVVSEFLEQFGYHSRRLARSPNQIFRSSFNKGVT